MPGKSLMYIKKSKGPDMLPWGTLYFMSLAEELRPLRGPEGLHMPDHGN